MDQRFPKTARLLKRSEFRRVYDQGTPHRNAGFHLFVRGRDEPGPTRLGLTATRRAGNSVRRNLLRRRARDVFRRNYGRLKAGYDLVVNFHPKLAEMPKDEFDRLFLDVLEKAHLLES